MWRRAGVGSSSASIYSGSSLLGSGDVDVSSGVSSIPSTMAGGVGMMGGMSSTDQVLFAINPVLYESCGLLLDRASGLTIASVMKLRQSSTTLSSISLANWKQIAVNIMGLREVTAYSIFDVFSALSGGCLQSTPSYYSTYSTLRDAKTVARLRHENNCALLAKMGGTTEESRWPAASITRHVSLPGLIIFLLMQVLLERPPHDPHTGVNLDLIVRSVKQNLHDYITAVTVTRPGRVTMADALELRFLLREFVNGVEQPFGTSLSLLWPRNEKTIDVAVLPHFIRPRIVLPSEVTTTRSGLSPRASTPALFSNNVVLSGLQDTVYIAPPSVMSENAAKLMSSNFTITQCSQTVFYLAAVIPHMRISQLTNCTVTLGPVSGILYVDRCVNCVVSALCGAVVVNQCTNVTVYVCTNTPPVLCQQDSSTALQGVRFAPYNSFYSTLEEHIASSGISPLLNLWNVGLPSQQYILPPDEFNPICFPVAPIASAGTTTQANPCVLPPAYAEVLQRRLRHFQSISRDLQKACQKLEDDGREDLAEQLMVKVQSMFIEWLGENGQGKCLLNLLHQNTSTPL